MAMIFALVVAITSWNPAKLALSTIGLIALAVAANKLLGGIWPSHTVPILLFGAAVAAIRFLAVAMRARPIQ